VKKVEKKEDSTKKQVKTDLKKLKKEKAKPQKKAV